MEEPRRLAGHCILHGTAEATAFEGGLGHGRLRSIIERSGYGKAGSSGKEAAAWRPRATVKLPRPQPGFLLDATARLRDIAVICSKEASMDAGSTSHARPAIFQDLPFTEAAARMERDHRLLVVDATASWCMPCQTMDRNTWVDAKVVEWLQQHALAIQIDVDAEPEAAKQLNIRSMPTLIAFRHGKEIDRTVGAKTPAALLDWLEAAAARGERSADRLRAEVSRTEEQTGTRGHPRAPGVGRALLQACELNAATEAFSWLWQHMLEHDEASAGVRLSFMTTDMTELAQSFVTRA